MKMSKVKIYILIFVILFVLALVASLQFEHKRYVREKARAERLQSNQDQLLATREQDLVLILTLKELLAVRNLHIDSLSKALKIRPKTIEHYVELITTIHDTIPKIVEVYPIINGWLIRDSGKCWQWQGFATLKDSSLGVIRKSFDYKDQIKEFFFWEREKKCWFVHYGKKKYYHKTLSECGTSDVKVFTITKSKKIE